MPDDYRVMDLFSGIGGFSLGLERAGMKTVAFCEQDGYACRVLRKHWPTLPIFEDIRTLTKRRLKSHGIEPNILCGGFPCQDISTAGKGAGIDGERSGLWREYARLIREIRPRYAIMENVAALRSRGLDRVLGDLAAIGYDAEWHCIPASYVGAHHQRDRVWIVGYSNRSTAKLVTSNQMESYSAASTGRDVADTLGFRLRTLARFGCTASQGGASERPFDGDSQRERWSPEPDLPRVADGIPHRVDRLRCLGNAVVPQIVEMIGKATVESDAQSALPLAVA